MTLFRFTLAVSLAAVPIDAAAASFPPIHGQRGMAVSASRHASEAGIAMLEQGGNAIDAAVAMGFALAVSYPEAGNIGGGGFLVAHLANGECITLDFREVAPFHAHRDMFLDGDGEVIPGASLRTERAAGVPGSVDGLLRVLDDHGSGVLSREEVLQPAIGLARGFALDRAFAEDLNANRRAFEADPAARAVFVREDGRPWEAGDRLVQENLANTLERIAQFGRDGFYAGPVAGMLVAKMEAGNGLITHEDLAAYRSVYREPARAAWRGLEIVTMGPPSSGGLILIHMLHMLDLLGIDEHEWNSAAYVHRLTEVQRLAYADRAKHMADADFWAVPVDTLLSAAYAEERASTIDPARATPSEAVFAGAIAIEETAETTHYAVADDLGNAVAVTTTLNGSYGSGLMVDGAGFFLNNEMDDFAIKPGVPNLYGLIGGEANAIEPRKRPLSSMTPTIVLEDGAPRFVLGTPGGATIITTVLQLILNLHLHGMDIQEAVDAPRVHSQWLPDNIRAERRALSSDTRAALEAMGHEVAVLQRETIGRAHAIAIEDGAFLGAPDPRQRHGSAVGR